MTSMTIRMGAAHWDATIHNAQGPDTVFEFRKMNRDERRVWYRMFMDGVRAVYGKGNDRPPRRSKARSHYRRRRPQKRAMVGA